MSVVFVLEVQDVWKTRPCSTRRQGKEKAPDKGGRWGGGARGEREKETETEKDKEKKTEKEKEKDEEKEEETE